MTVLVTGAGGFIGSHLVEALLRKNYRVRALIKYNGRGDWGNLNRASIGSHDKLDVRLGDVTDSHLVRDLVAGCEVVFHLAALVGIPYSFHATASYVTTNLCGTLNILEACKEVGVRRLIITSTSEVYGTARYTPIDEAHPLQAQSPYAASKIAADKLAESYFCSQGLPVIILRPFNTYGPRQSARAVIPAVMTQALKGAREVHLGNLSAERDLTFIDDSVNAFLLAADTPGIEGETIHFGQGHAISVGELAERCLEAVGSPAQIVSVAERRRPLKSEVELLLCDASKAKRVIGWQPRVPLNEGLRRTAAYLRDNLALYPADGYVT